MRKLNKFWPVRSRIFRSLLVVAGVFLLTAALAPKANATVLIYFNFEDSAIGSPFDPASDNVPPLGDNPGGGIQDSTLFTNLVTTGTVAGTSVNRTAGDIDTTNNLAIGMRTTPADNGHWIQFGFPGTLFSNMSLSFACNTSGNGFSSAQLFYSLDGGTTFTAAGTAALPTGGGFNLITFTVPAAVDNQPSVILRLVFTGGHSSGQNLQTIIDNIQLTGTAVPEPATVAGGLLGVLGLCWFQRRRLIRASVRFRRA